MKNNISETILIPYNQFWSNKKIKDKKLIKFNPEKSAFKICNKCKKLKPKNEFYKDRNTKDSLRYDCKKCKAKQGRKYYQKNKEKIKRYQKKYGSTYCKTSEGKYLRYIRESKRKNINFDLYFEEFIKITNNPCHYCGSNKTNYGIDRKNNSEGYTKINSVSCCWACNRAKYMMTEKELAGHIYNMYHNWAKHFLKLQ